MTDHAARARELVKAWRYESRGCAACCEECRDDLVASITQALRDAERAGVEAFYKQVNARAEADMLAGNPITGAHHRALEAEINKVRALLPPPEEDAQ